MMRSRTLGPWLAALLWGAGATACRSPRAPADAVRSPTAAPPPRAAVARAPHPPAGEDAPWTWSDAVRRAFATNEQIAGARLEALRERQRRAGLVRSPVNGTNGEEAEHRRIRMRTLTAESSTVFDYSEYEVETRRDVGAAIRIHTPNPWQQHGLRLEAEARVEAAEGRVRQAEAELAARIRRHMQTLRTLAREAALLEAAADLERRRAADGPAMAEAALRENTAQAGLLRRDLAIWGALPRPDAPLALDDPMVDPDATAALDGGRPPPALAVLESELRAFEGARRAAEGRRRPWIEYIQAGYLQPSLDDWRRTVTDAALRARDSRTGEADEWRFEFAIRLPLFTWGRDDPRRLDRPWADAFRRTREAYRQWTAEKAEAEERARETAEALARLRASQAERRAELAVGLEALRAHPEASDQALLELEAALMDMDRMALRYEAEAERAALDWWEAEGRFDVNGP
jgi:hypothetical protein